MCAQIIEARVIQKIATPEQWRAISFTPYRGEILIVGDSSGKVTNIKVGDGSNDFDGLEYMFDSIQQNANYIPVSGYALPTPEADSGFSIVLSGEYTFNGNPAFTVSASSMAIVYWDGTAWAVMYESALNDVDFDGKIEEGNEDGVSGGTVYNKIATPIGLDFEDVGYNILTNLNPLNVDDTSVWSPGYYQSDGNIGSGSWVNTIINLPKGSYTTNNYISGLASYVLFDKNMNVIGSYTSKGNVSGTGEWILEMPVDGYLGISQGRSIVRDPFYLNANQTTPIASGKVFVLQSEFKDKSKQVISEEMSENYGVNPIPVGVNFVEHLITTDLSDEAIWARGFLREDGSVEVVPDFYHNREYLELSRGDYEFYFWFSGNARAIIYNKDLSIQQTILKPSGGDGFSGTFTIQEDSFIRFSHRQTSASPERLASVYIKNTNEIIPTIITSENISDYAQTQINSVRDVFRSQNRPKMKRPIVTLISDDLHQYNETWYVPMLDEYDVKSTFAVIGEKTEEADNGIENGYLPSSYIKQLYADGHNIASHTWTHRRMNEIPLNEVEDELSRTKLYLEQFTHTPVNMFVSPFGIRGASIDNLVSKYYDANFISGYGSLNPTPLDNYFLNRVSFDDSETDPQLRWDTILKPAIDEAISENNWLIFAVHPQYVQYRGTSGEARRNELRTLIEYCKTNNVQILTADKAFNYWKNSAEIGVQRVDDRYYKLGMDGTEINAGYFED